MKIEELYDIAEKNNINIIEMNFNNIKSVSAYGNIGIDPRKLVNTAEKKTCICHELGHCSTGSFYNLKSKYDTIERQEHRADVWAINKLIPLKEYEKAVRSGIVEVWELAEHFETTEEYIKKAAEYYEADLLEAN